MQTQIKKMGNKIIAALLGFAAITAALWWAIFALKPYPLSPAELQARYSYTAPAAFAPVLKDLGEHSYDIRFTSFDGAPVNGRIKYPSDPSLAQTPFPLLIGLHGLGRSHMRWWQSSFKGSETVEQTQRITELALQNGYAVLALDARAHGERKNLEYTLKDLMLDLELWGQREPYEQMIAGSVKDYRLLLDWLLTQPLIDGRRVKVSGYSMGGQMALILASQEPRITAVAAIVPPHLDDKVAAVSPLRFMPGLAGKKLWLLSADDDEHASAQQNQALFDALPGSDKKHLRFPGGHLLPAGYAAGLAPWF